MSAHDLLLLHGALLSGEPTAPRELVERATPRLIALLRRNFVTLPVEEVEDAAHDALLNLIAAPEQFDARRGSILNYLLRVASNDLLSRIRKVRRRAQWHEEKYTADVAQDEDAAHYWWEEVADPARWGQPGVFRLNANGYSPEVADLLYETLPEQRDRELLALILQGRTSMEEYARLLGLESCPLEEVRHEAKKQRDRILKKIQRRRQEWRELLLP